MQIETYSGKYDDEIISLILDIQNHESKINLSLEEQPDLLTIYDSYQENGGEFWIALDQGKVIGTLGMMLKDNHCAIMKKFFVKKKYRSQRVGLALYKKLLEFAEAANVQYIILDTPSVAHASHRFYEKAGFRKINKIELPVPYEYPDRDSILYMLDLGGKARMTEWKKLQAGQMYNDFDDDLFQRRIVAKKLFRAYNKTEDEEVEKRNEILAQLLRKVRKDVWLGGDVKVLGGVTIGDNTIIGTGSIVTKDIPENVIAVGNPCRVLRKITEADKTDYLKCNL